MAIAHGDMKAMDERFPLVYEGPYPPILWRAGWVFVFTAALFVHEAGAAGGAPRVLMLYSNERPLRANSVVNEAIRSALAAESDTPSNSGVLNKSCTVFVRGAIVDVFVGDQELDYTPKIITDEVPFSQTLSWQIAVPDLWRQNMRALLCSSVVLLVTGCWPAPGAGVAHTTALVYTRGARQNTVSIRLKAPPRDVFAALERILETRPDLEIIKRDPGRRLVEVAKDDLHLAAQATDLGGGETLLFVWADAGTSGRTGRDLALDAVEQLCRELGISYEVVER
jgi:hypothetical protein